jgi:hypothetical protein
VRLVLATSIALVVLLAPACSSGFSSTTTEAKDCLYRSVFAALDEVRGVRALCPAWLPDSLRPTYINANTTTGYVVEFEPLGKLFPHVVFQLTLDDPPGDQIAEAEVGAKRAAIYFAPSSPSAPAGLHSGHYVVAFPGTAHQRGIYWVSIHEDSRRSRQSNIQRVLRIARSLRPVPSL